MTWSKGPDEWRTLPRGKPGKPEFNVQDFKGKDVAIDVSCLMHAMINNNRVRHDVSLAQCSSPPWTAAVVPSYLDRFWAYRKLDKLANVVYFVFDGGKCPAKSRVHEERSAKRVAAEAEMKALREEALQGTVLSVCV